MAAIWMLAPEGSWQGRHNGLCRRDKSIFVALIPYHVLYTRKLLLRRSTANCFSRLIMSPFVLSSSSGVRKAGRGEYRSTTDDPRFVYRFWIRRPRHIVVFLQALNNSLDPKIYTDRGNGFDEAGSISLTHTGTCIYSISISEPRRVARIRIDPCSSEERFRYWAKFAWNEADLAILLKQAKQGAEVST